MHLYLAPLQAQLHIPRVVKLKQKKGGGFYQRHRIPEDVRGEYHRLYGKSSEEWLTTSADVDRATAERQWKEWSAEVTTRIANIRAQRGGSGISLTRQQAYALAGKWYEWFLALHKDDPKSPQHWSAMLAWFLDRIEIYAPEWAHEQGPWKTIEEWRREPQVREGMRPLIADEAKTAQFLAARGLTLSSEAQALFLDCVLNEFDTMIVRLERRAKNIYEPNDDLEAFPKFELDHRPGRLVAGTDFLGLFESYVHERKPAPTTVSRWRGVFANLNEHFKGRDPGSITGDEAFAWIEGLVTPERTADTIIDVWQNAAHAVFNWAVGRRKLSNNPFKFTSEPLTRQSKAQAREPVFRREEIALILGAALATMDTKRPSMAARRWVPWLCAYTGARAGEITQLRKADVVQRDGHWCIQITPEAGTVKTKAARTVPLHEHLIEQGFIEFVRSRKDGPLFYKSDTPSKAKTMDTLHPPKARSVKTREHLAAWVRDIGVTDKGVQPITLGVTRSSGLQIVQASQRKPQTPSLDMHRRALAELTAHQRWMTWLKHSRNFLGMSLNSAAA